MARLSQEYENAIICHTTTYYSSRELADLTGVDGKFNRMTERVWWLLPLMMYVQVF